jgi:uncharacterized protein YodC (DUF2158 family)
VRVFQGDPGGGEMTVGDIVRIKSGGPKMVISAISRDEDDDDFPTDIATCWWFSDGMVYIDAKSDDVRGHVQVELPLSILEIVKATTPKKKTKLLVTERESDLEAAKHELDAYLKNDKKEK